MRWLRCHGCGWEHTYPLATVGGDCPHCIEGKLHIHNDSDGELPKPLSTTPDALDAQWQFTRTRP